MSYNPKRKYQEYDPKSDSDDEDYDNKAPSSSTRSRPLGKRGQQHRGSPRKPKKRPRQSYGDSDDDISVDDELSDEESIADDSDEEEEDYTNHTSTGRRQRKAARKPVQYQEDSEEEEIQATDEASPEPQARAHADRDRKSLIVKFHIDPERLSDVVGEAHDEMARPLPRVRSTRAASRRGSTPLAGAGPRRSSRISRSSEEPLVQLTDSGKHTESAPTGSVEPPEQGRQTRGGKGLKTFPSTIMEASHEDSGASHAPAADDFMSQLQEHAAEGEVKDEMDEGISPMASEAQLETDVVPQSEAEGEAHDEVDDDEDDDMPRKPSRSLRVSLNVGMSESYG